MKSSLLNQIKIASPCSADWNEMYGDNRKRFCSECRLNVYNLSEMTRREAENFLFEAEGRVCVRLYRRSDGTVITRNCPVGWQAVKQRVSRLVTATFSLTAGFFGGLWGFTQISNIYLDSIEKIAAETNNEMNYAVTDTQETNVLVEEGQLTHQAPKITRQAYVGRVDVRSPEKSKQLENEQVKSTGAIDFSISGGVSNMDELKFWIFTERYPK